VGSVSFDRAGVAAHATQLANTIQGNLKRSLEALGVVSSSVTVQTQASIGSQLIHRVQTGTNRHEQ
jgi:hypothetical protein